MAGDRSSRAGRADLHPRPCGIRRALDAELSTGFISGARTVLFGAFRDFGFDLPDEGSSWEGIATGESAHILASTNRPSSDPYKDVAVHEAAHLLHYLKPEHHGIRPPRGQERFVEVQFAKRELFAYSCEAYTIVHARPDRKARLAVAARMPEEAASFPEEMRGEVAELVAAAAKSRIGWKVIRDATVQRRTRASNSFNRNRTLAT